MNRQFVQGIVEPLTKVVGVEKSNVSLAMALAIGYALPLPNQGVENAPEWYQEQYRWKVNQFVAEFNERYLLDCQLVLSGAKEVWLSRYQGMFVHDQIEMQNTLSGNTPAVRFLKQYEDNLQDRCVVAEAAYLLHSKLMPVLLDMTRPNAAVK